MMVTLIIDEVEVTVPEETKILDAAQQGGIYIPHLCSHPDLPRYEQLKPAEFVYRSNVRLENKKPDLLYGGCQLCVVEIVWNLVSGMTNFLFLALLLIQ